MQVAEVLGIEGIVAGRLETYKIPQKMEFTEDALTTERFKTTRR